MKALRYSILVLFAVNLIGHAEIFFGPSTSTNRLVIKSGEAILVSSIIPDSNSAPTFSLVVTNQGIETVYPPVNLTQTIGSPYSRIPIVMAGPLEIRAFDRFAMSFSRIQNSLAQTAIVPTNVTLTIPVPANKTITLYPSIRLSDTEIDRLEIQDTNGIPLITLDGILLMGQAISGPVNLIFPPASLGSANAGGYRLLTYTISSDFVAVPPLGVISGGNGKLAIIVEKSQNLTNWAPILQHFTDDDQTSFYRFRIQH